MTSPRIKKSLTVWVARIYWRLLRPKTYGVKIIIGRGEDKRILLVKHSYDDMWNFPGGGFNPSRESPEEAAKRELQEELSIQSIDLAINENFYTTDEGKKDTVYVLKGMIEEDTLVDGVEVVETGWFNPDSLPKH